MSLMTVTVIGEPSKPAPTYGPGTRAERRDGRACARCGWVFQTPRNPGETCDSCPGMAELPDVDDAEPGMPGLGHCGSCGRDGVPVYGYRLAEDDWSLLCCSLVERDWYDSPEILDCVWPGWTRLPNGRSVRLPYVLVVGAN